MLDFPEKSLQSIDVSSLDSRGTNILNNLRSDIATTKEIFDVISEYLYVGVWKARDTGFIVSENHIIPSMFEKSLVNQHITTIVPPDYRDSFIPTWMNFIKSSDQESLIQTFHYNFKDHQKWLRTDFKKLSNGELLGVVNDVTVENNTIPLLREFQSEMKNILKNHS